MPETLQTKQQPPFKMGKCFQRQYLNKIYILLYMFFQAYFSVWKSKSSFLLSQINWISKGKGNSST